MNATYIECVSFLDILKTERPQDMVFYFHLLSTAKLTLRPLRWEVTLKLSLLPKWVFFLKSDLLIIERDEGEGSERCKVIVLLMYALTSWCLCAQWGIKPATLAYGQHPNPLSCPARAAWMIFYSLDPPLSLYLSPCYRWWAERSWVPDQGHRAIQWQRQGSNPDILTTELTLLAGAGASPASPKGF